MNFAAPSKEFIAYLIAVIMTCILSQDMNSFSAFTSIPISLLVTNKTFYFALQKACFHPTD
jgi:hypothetical protein